MAPWDRERFANVRAEQKWDYINLNDFKSSSCWAPFSYGILYISLIVSIAVYAVDTFTAINLVAFDRWSGKVKPAIPFTISRWIFAACIIISFILLFYRWWRAIRVMKNGGVAQSYLDPLAVRIQSIRMGKRGRGWRRFLVFAELTKSKKGADYVALFTYFSFEAWLRIVFAEGPRQVVNALTLWSVMRLNLLPQGEHKATDGHTPVIQFFVNVSVLADQSQLQAVILFGMLFTLVIWVISAINLALAVIMYLLFLWHHVPSSDGSLTKYCRRKINERAEKVIGAKMNKALRREQIQMRESRSDTPDALGQIKRQPTLPVLGTAQDDKLPEMPMLSRATTDATLPQYSSAAPSVVGMDRAPTLPDLTLDTKRPPPSRHTTASSARSTTSYNSDAPLLGSSADMGYSNSPMSPMDDGYTPPVPMSRGMTPDGFPSYGPGSRPPTSQGRRTPGQDYPGNYPPGRGPPVRSNTGMSAVSQASTGRRPTPGPSQMGRSYTPVMSPPPQGREWPLPSNSSSTPAQNFAWPLPSPDQATPQSGPSRTAPPGNGLSRNPSAGQGNGNYTAYSPSVHPQSSATPGSRGNTYRGVGPTSLTSRPPQDYFSSGPQGSSMTQPPIPRTGTSPPQTQYQQSTEGDYSGDGWGNEDDAYDIYDSYASDPTPAPSAVPTLPNMLPTPTSMSTQSRAPTLPNVQMPPRAATSSLGAQQRQAPPRSTTASPSSGQRPRPQQQSPPSQQAWPVQQRSQTPTSQARPTLPALQTHSQAPSQQVRSQTSIQQRSQTPIDTPETPHQTLKEQLAQGGKDWRANDGKAAVQGGGSSNVFDW